MCRAPCAARPGRASALVHTCPAPWSLFVQALAQVFAEGERLGGEPGAAVCLPARIVGRCGVSALSSGFPVPPASPLPFSAPRVAPSCFVRPRCHSVQTSMPSMHSPRAPAGDRCIWHAQGWLARGVKSAFALCSWSFGAGAHSSALDHQSGAALHRVLGRTTL